MASVGFVYMVRCSDERYYVGSHRGEDVERRVWQHNEGVDRRSYTFRRRPVELVWSEYFERYDEMIASERQIKGWSRAKKEALIRGDSAALHMLSVRGGRASLVSDPSRRPSGPPQDED